MKNDMLKNVIFKFPENFQRLLTSIIVPMTIYFISTLDRRDSSGRYFWIALGIFVVGWIVAEYINWRNAQREREKNDGETLSDILKVFRFRPYNEIDHDTYFRPDALHEKALDWLVSSEEKVLYLTGASGAGKTSLLRAWLAPEFRKLNPENEFWIFDNLDNLVLQLHFVVMCDFMISDFIEGSRDVSSVLARNADRLEVSTR